MTVGQLLREADSRELAEWRAYYQLKREDAATATLEAVALRGADEVREKLSGGA
jgi:hypothetical protein